MDDILKFLVESGKIDLEDIKNEIKLKENKRFLEEHKFKVWQGNNGKWYTYLPDEKKGRVQRVRNSRKDIEDLIISFYRKKEENPTIKTLFYEWLKRKIENMEIEESTYTRYKVDFERCFSDFGKMKIRDVNELDIEDFLKKCVHEKSMSRKAYSNIRTLMYGIFKYAKKRKLIDYDIKCVIDDIDFSKKEFTKIIHDDIEQVFSQEEENNIILLMESDQDIINLGLLLMFKSGIRVGELCSLKPSDINGNTISIRRTETIFKDRETGKIRYDIKEHPKTDAGIRDVIIKDDSIWLLKKIKSLNPFGEFLFMKNGKRIRSYVFRNRLYANCKKSKSVIKSPHKVRKTYGTKLYDSEIPKSLVCEQMGHTDISCLQKHYYYNRQGKEEKSDNINKVAYL